MEYDVRGVLMDAHRVVALYGVVTTLMAGLARVFTSIYTQEMGWRNDGGGDLRSVHTRR